MQPHIQGACFVLKEGEKRRGYEEQVREIEREILILRIFTTSGGLAPTATITYKRMASLRADKK